MPELIVEIHVPLIAAQGISSDDYQFPWIDTIDDFLNGYDGPGERYDDGEEWSNEEGEPEYVFFVGGSSEQDLMAIARTVADLPTVPLGVYVTVNDSEGDLGAGQRIDLD